MTALPAELTPQELSLPKNPLGKGFTSLLSGLGPNLKVLDAAEASLDDEAALATSKTITRWPFLRSLRLAGNEAQQKLPSGYAMTLLGIEALVRSMLLAKDLQQLDLRGSSTTPLAVEWHRLMKLLQKGNIDTRKLRLSSHGARVRLPPDDRSSLGVGFLL
eukprot:s11_g69.t1